MAELINKVQQSDNPQIKDVKVSTAADLKDRANEINPDLDRLRETHRHQEDMMKYGRFGGIFGAEENSSKALTFTLIIIIIIVWLILVICSIWVSDLIDRASEFFKTIIPVITLAFGYFFGKK